MDCLISLFSLLKVGSGGMDVVEEFGWRFLRLLSHLAPIRTYLAHLAHAS